MLELRESIWRVGKSLGLGVGLGMGIWLPLVGLLGMGLGSIYLRSVVGKRAMAGLRLLRLSQ